MVSCQCGEKENPHRPIVDKSRWGGTIGRMVLGEQHAHRTDSIVQTRCQEKKAPNNWRTLAAGGNWKINLLALCTYPTSPEIPALSACPC